MVQHIMNKLYKEAYDQFAGTDWPTYDDYINDNFNDPLIELEIKQLEKQSAELNTGYDYNSRRPTHIHWDKLDDDQKYKLTKSDWFCMMPWVHMHAFPDGRAYPCCLADYWSPVGDLRKNTMEEVWNQDPYKQMRRNMLADKSCKECVNCYEREQHGAFSMRNDANKTYGHLVHEIKQTEPDGHHEEFKIRYWDVRFSNLCNFSCRSCGPIFSSNWYNDHVSCTIASQMC